jgi:hypothetical protein
MPTRVKMRLLIMMMGRKFRVSLVAIGSLISRLSRILSLDGLLLDLDMVFKIILQIF